MIKFTLNKLSRIVLNSQDKKKKEIFKKINNNNFKLCILDIGGAGGIQLRWKLFKDEIRIIYIEPDKRSFEELKSKNFEALNSAVWSEETKKNFYLTKKYQTSSIYKPNIKFLNQFPNSERFDITEIININVTTLDKIIKKSNQPHFLKLDIQGAELEVLKGSRSILKNVIGIEIELNFKTIYKDMPLAHYVEQFLQNNDFYLNDYLTFQRWDKISYSGYGEIIYADGLFLRTTENIIQLANNNQNPMEVLEIYVKILFAYNKLDLLKDLSNKVTKKQKEKLNLTNIINLLDNNFRKLKFLNKISGYYTRYFISKDIKPPHWEL